MATAIAGVTNGAVHALETEQPYTILAKVRGVCPLLFHAWDCAAVQEKSVAKKGSRAKKSDNLASYIHRGSDGCIAIPGEYFRMAIVHAARFSQDPRSPRKSAMDLMRAAFVVNEELLSLGVREWDYIDRRRVQVQRNGVTRERPAMSAGWRAEFTATVICPEYVAPPFLHHLLSQAGRLVGVGDFRPTFGRFQVDGFDIVS